MRSHPQGRAELGGAADTIGMTSFSSPTGGGFKPNGGSHFGLICRNRAIHCSLLRSVSPQRPTGEVFELEIDTLETTCHALDPTPVVNCSVRQQVEHVSGTLRVAAGSGPASSTAVLHRAGPCIQPPSLPSWLASVQLLKLPYEAAFPGTDSCNSSAFLL